jgi:Tol biopolymer transport system component
MLCHDVNTGRKWISYANASGQFTGTNWERAMGWCNHSGAQVHIGDFNADGRSDMLCHDVNTGRKWIAYANSSGQFTATNWELAMGWCNHSGARVHIGDFNGDGRSDMLCHDTTGRQWVALANGSGQFTGTTWSTTSSWCGHAGSELRVGDFNADGRSDMLCHDTSGRKWVAFASATGTFSGTSRSWLPGAAMQMADARRRLTPMSSDFLPRRGWPEVDFYQMP